MNLNNGIKDSLRIKCLKRSSVSQTVKIIKFLDKVIIRKVKLLSWD